MTRRVNDSSSHDSILFAFFAGEREDSSLRQRLASRSLVRVIQKTCLKLQKRLKCCLKKRDIMGPYSSLFRNESFFRKFGSRSSLTRTSHRFRGQKTSARPNTIFPRSTQHYCYRISLDLGNFLRSGTTDIKELFCVLAMS
jgi:hypothetical protein